MSDPEYRAKMEEKERLALEREKKRQERATKKKKIALAEWKEQAEKGNQEAIRELEERRAIARERSRKSAEKRKQRAENDPEYAKYLEERNTEYNRRHTARRKEQMEALRARAEAGDQKAQSQLAERKQYQVRATVKSYRKMREDALNGDPIAKERYEKTLAMRREAYHAKKREQTAWQYAYDHDTLVAELMRISGSDAIIVMDNEVWYRIDGLPNRCLAIW